MAIGDPYATLAELKDYLKLTGTTEFDDRLTDALLSASREVERYCNRQFNQVTSATSRVYRPGSLSKVMSDDFYSTTGFALETDPGGDGTFGVLWTDADYELSPDNGIVDGQPGWPYWKIEAVRGLYFPINNYGKRSTVRVTAKWGWAAVPAPVKQATLIMAAETYSLKGAPLGVAGFGDFGPIRVRDNKMASAKLMRYRRNAVLVG